MASSTDVSMRIGVEGEQDFKKSLKDIDSNLKVLGSEMKAVTSEFIGNEKSSKSLASQNEVLTKTYEAQKSKVELLTQQLAKEVELHGENTKNARDLQIQLNKATAEMNKSSAAIKSNSEEIKNNQKSAINWKDTLKSAASAVSGIAQAASKATAAMAASVTAVVGGMAALTVKAAYAADDLNTLSAQTGISTDQLQKYQFAAEQVDVDVDTIAKSMAKLTKQMGAADKGTGAAAEAFGKLGVNIKDTQGNFRDNEDVFNDAIKALGKIENETERDALAMEIFGKSAQELNPLIKGGADTLAELGKQAEQAGLILSESELGQLNQVSDALDTLKATAGAAGRVMMVGFAEPFAAAINTVTGYINELVSAFRDGGMDGLASAAADVMDDVLTKINEYLPAVFEFGSNLLLQMVEGLVAMLPDIIETASTIILTLANGLADSLPTLIPALVQTIIAICDGLIDNLPKLVEAALKIIVALAGGLIQALPELIKKIPEIIVGIVRAIKDNLPQIKEAGKDLIRGFWEGIQNLSTWLWEKVSGFFSGIVDGVKGFLGIHSPSTVFAGIGKNMALGLGKGWDSGFERISDDITNSVSGISAISAPVSAEATFGSSFVGGMSSVGEIIINLTAELDGAVLAQKQYRYNQLETARHGGSLVNT